MNGLIHNHLILVSDSNIVVIWHQYCPSVTLSQAVISKNGLLELWLEIRKPMLEVMLTGQGSNKIVWSIPRKLCIILVYFYSTVNCTEPYD